MTVLDLTVNARATQSIDVRDPATGELVGRIPAGSAGAADAAVRAARVVESFDEALAEANRGEYGLAAVVLTPSPANAQRAWRELEVGTVRVNAVSGGAPGGAAEPRRCSGHGFGYGPELLDEVTHTKVVHLALAPG